METLEELRERIDSLDKTLREAFLARMQAAAAQALLEKLGAVCRTVRVLGVYSRGAAERSPL